MSLFENYFLIYFLAGQSVLATLYVVHFVFLRDVFCILTQRAAVASWRAANLATHLSTQPPITLSQPSPYYHNTQINIPIFLILRVYQFVNIFHLPHREKKDLEKGERRKANLKKRRLIFYSFSTPVPNAWIVHWILTFSLPAVPRLQLCRRGICHTTNLAIWETEGGGQFFMHVKKNFPCNAEGEKLPMKKKG